MKLSTKNSIVFLVVTLGVFCIGAYIFYVQLRNILDEEATEEVQNLKEDVAQFIDENKRFPESVNALTLLQFDSVSTKGSERILDSTIFVPSFEETLPFKLIVFYKDGLKITVGKAVFEKDDLIETIINSFLMLAAVLTAVLIVVNYVYSRFMWKPFFKTLNSLSSYEVGKHGTILYSKSSTTEFNKLSAAVNKMTEKLSTDYQTLRSFSENASHELQTPIAVIITRTENLLQANNLRPEQKEEVYSINQTAIKLKKLNQTLLLLSKIENDQFKVIRDTNITERLKAKLEQYDDLLKMKEIVLIVSAEDNVVKSMDPVLVDTVISNLLGNAIKYTSKGKEIRVKLDQNSFSVSNWGEPLNVDGNKLFERFFKLNQDSDSSGLGLALVKQIAATHGHHVTYDHRQDLHIFEYKFE